MPSVVRQPTRFRGPFTIGLLAIVLLVVVVYALSEKFEDSFEDVQDATLPGLTEEHDEPIIPGLAAAGSSLDGYQPVSFDDLSPQQSPEEIAEAIKIRLNLSSDDEDKDGLSNAAEVLIYGTNPKYYDTNLDGVSDGESLAELEASFGDEIAKRLSYWRHDFALTPEAQERAARDLIRQADATRVLLLLNTYHDQVGAYPIADSLPTAWAILQSIDAGGLLAATAGEAGVAVPTDPLANGPYSYSYAATGDGSSYTLTRVSEVEQVTYTISQTAGLDPEVSLEVFEEVAEPTTDAPLSSSLWQSLIPTAHATPSGSTVVTTDGVEIKVVGSESALWLAYIPLHTKDEVFANFRLVTGTQSPAGTCDDLRCYSTGVILISELPESLTIGTPSRWCCDPWIVTGFLNSRLPALGIQPVREAVHFDDPTAQKICEIAGYETVSQKLCVSARGRGRGNPYGWGCGYSSPGNNWFWSFNRNGNNLGQNISGRFISNQWISRVICTDPIQVDPPTACSNGIDDDGDGKVDCTDPGCYPDGDTSQACDPTDDDETDPIPECSDGIDNDGDGKIDCDDAGCHLNDRLDQVCVPDDTTENEAPIARITASAGELDDPIQISGATSRDPEGGVLTYAWEVTKPSGVTLSFANETHAFPGDEEGTWIVRLTVTDTGGATGTASTSVRVLNTPVTALLSAIGSTVNFPVALDGSQSKPLGTITSYDWTAKDPNGADIAVSDGALSTFTPTTEGVHTITLTVTDAKGRTDTGVLPLDITGPRFNPGTIQEDE